MNDIQRAGVTSRFEIRIEDKTYVGADGTLIPAIRDFVLAVESESMTVLMGPSGCGKTTLLRIIAGLDDRYTGEVESPPDARIGLMFQDPRLLPWRTVKQNIELVAAPGFTEEDLEQLAQSVGIADMLPRYPQELSLGLARRVALARAFATKPDLLLLDEPFVSLDERTADRLRQAAARCLVGAADHGDPRHAQCARGDPARRSARAAGAAPDPRGRDRDDRRAASASAIPR